ncbi:hypothetical protein TNCV_219831 [Trichonephila clavipes]|nr:hypothetical protein TNCV_219831 [Trichonephila clavipes]
MTDIKSIAGPTQPKNRKVNKKVTEAEVLELLEKRIYRDNHAPSYNNKDVVLPRISVTFPSMKSSPSSSRFIHVKRPGSPTRIFRETTV